MPFLSFIFGNNARNTLFLIEKGEANYGIVYKTDALNSSKVLILKEVSVNLYSQIIYPIILIQYSKNNSKIILDFLFSKEAKKIFQKWGFLFQ